MGKVKYVVVDEMCCSENEFNNLSEAKKYALNIQGVLYKIDEHGDRVFLLSYAD